MTTSSSLISTKNGITFVEPFRVYNLPLYESFFVLDCRRKSEFEKSRIATSVSFDLNDSIKSNNNTNDGDDDSFSNQLLKLFEEQWQSNFPENLFPIVLYHDGSNETQESKTLMRIAEFILSLRNENNSKIQDALLRNKFKTSQPTTKYYQQYVWIMSGGGFNGFKRHFSFLCDVSLSLDNLPPLPAIIQHDYRSGFTLYLGSRPSNSVERRNKQQLAQDYSTLLALGIEYIIVNQSAHLPLEDTNGIECLTIDIPDKNDVENMAVYWNVVSDMIEQKRREGKKILIQVYGRSRSSSFCVAYLMRFKNCSFAEAMKVVQQNCYYSLDQSSMWLSQLSDFGTDKSTIMESEMTTTTTTTTTSMTTNGNKRLAIEQ